MAAASCNLLHLSVPKNTTFRPITPSHLSAALPRLRPLVGTCRVGARPPAPAGWAPNPAASRADVLCFNSGYNVQVVVGEDEPEEVLLRRFRREVTRAGVIQECKRRRFFENKQEEKKRKAREAGRRNRRRRSGPRTGSPSSSTSDSSSKAAVEDIDDNWDMPDGDLPY